jgi:S1-C subfamily serine protease
MSDEPAPGGSRPGRRALAQGLRSSGLAVAALVCALIAFGLFLFSRPPRGLTPEEVDGLVQRHLEKATLAPSMASQAFAAIVPSVVRIDIRRDGEERGGVGAGVLIDERGLLLTAYHVVAGADHIRVVYSDGTQSDALVVAEEPERDTAVLLASVVPDDVIAATLAPSASLRIGDEVIAVGSPYGLTHTLTLGVVSGLQRRFRAPAIGQTLDNVIQFDAAVNPGNSGGPLVNRYGEVVGIVSGLLNPEGEVFIGIGFAVPIEAAAAAAGPPWE